MRFAVRHCTGKMTDNGSETSAPPSSEPISEPAASDRDADEFIMPVDLDVLIDQIKSHPVLYKTAQAEYRERMEKEMVWAEICSHLFKRWCEYSPQKKRDRIREVQKKWKNMMDDYFDFTCQLSPVQKKRKTIFDRMSFLGDPAVAEDVDMGAYRLNNTNNNNNNEEFAPILDPITTPHVEMPNLTMPSTSAQVEDFSNTYEVKKMPIFVPTANIPSQSEPSNPNLYFSLMLVPLLNRLSQDKLYAVWPKILKIIEETEGPSKLQILQQELIYPQGGQPTTLAEPEPEPAEEEGPVYSCSHGRPKNKDGEIIYPETDHEDLDDV